MRSRRKKEESINPMPTRSPSLSVMKNPQVFAFGVKKTMNLSEPENV
jgi:hypothetical protein